MDATNRFTGKAAIYAEYRSTYPPQYIDYLVSSSSLTPEHRIADIGSGTGILTRQLLNRGLQVSAIEPNADMRAAAESALQHYSGFSSFNGTAEQTELPDQSIDFITVAQAFHWFDKESFLRECRRVLKQDARVALVWNSRVSTSELIMANWEICKAYCPEFIGFSGGIEETPAIYQQFFRNGEYEYRQFENPLTFDLNSFIGRNLSASYAPKQTDEQYDPFVQALTELYAKYSKDDVLVMPNATRSYMGKV